MEIITIEIKEQSTITFDTVEEFEEYVDSKKSTLADNEKIISTTCVVACILVIKTT